MKVLISGNNRFGLSAAIAQLYPNMTFASRSTGFDLTTDSDQNRFATLALEHDVVILCSALYKFNQVILLDKVNEECVRHKHFPHIICCGSTTDRVSSGKIWLYNAEKKALRDYCNTLSINSAWRNNPQVTLISLGTLSNNCEKHPGRKTIEIESAAKYVKWVMEQPKSINVNEISLDPIQREQ